MGVPIETPVTPSDADVALAQQSSRTLAAFTGDNLTVSIGSKGKSKEIELPAVAVEMLVKMLAEMAEGNAVTLMPVHARLTTQQAADLLGVSRPFVIEQMKAGLIPFEKVGTHRRILFAELVRYQQKMTKESNDAMDELVAQAQELNMGY